MRFLATLASRAVAAGATETTPVFFTFEYRPFPDYKLRRLWKKGATALGFKATKMRPHAGSRKGGKTALRAAGVSKEMSTWFGRWVEGSDAAEEVYTWMMRGEQKNLQKMMLTAHVVNREFMGPT